MRRASGNTGYCLFSAGSVPGEVSAAKETLMMRIEVILLPLASLVLKILGMPCGIALGFGNRDRFPKSVMRIKAHEFAQINIRHARVIADHEHVLVVGSGTCLAEVGGAENNDR